MENPSSSSSSSRKSSGKAKFGDKWTYTVYFDPEADKEEDEEEKYYFHGNDLIEMLLVLVDYFEEIEQVTVYKLPLSKWQFTDWIFYHNFVQLKTVSMWYTIEKNSEGITIQRSKYQTAVKDRYRQKKRDPRITKVVEDTGRQSVENIIVWLMKENELDKEYHYLFSNCKHFAQAVFNYVARSQKYLSWDTYIIAFSVRFIEFFRLIMGEF